MWRGQNTCVRSQAGPAGAVLRPRDSCAVHFAARCSPHTRRRKRASRRARARSAPVHAHGRGGSACCRATLPRRPARAAAAPRCATRCCCWAAWRRSACQAGRCRPRVLEGKLRFGIKTKTARKHGARPAMPDGGGISSKSSATRAQRPSKRAAGSMVVRRHANTAAMWAATRAAAAAAGKPPHARVTADAWFVGGSVAVASTGTATPVAGAAMDNAVHAVRPADWNAASAVAGLLDTLCRLADTVPAAPAVVATEKSTLTAAAAASRCRPDAAAGELLTAVMLTALAATDREEAMAALNAAACAVPNVEAVYPLRVAVEETYTVAAAGSGGGGDGGGGEGGGGDGGGDGGGEAQPSVMTGEMGKPLSLRL